MLIDKFVIISSQIVLFMKHYISVDLVINVLNEETISSIYKSIRT